MQWKGARTFERPAPARDRMRCPRLKLAPVSPRPTTALSSMPLARDRRRLSRRRRSGISHPRCPPWLSCASGRPRSLSLSCARPSLCPIAFSLSLIACAQLALGSAPFLQPPAHTSPALLDYAGRRSA